MANTIKLGAGKWATGTDTVLAFNDENNNFKPLPFSFSRASSATVVNQSGLIETVGSGEPRIDFLGNTKGALLLEPQRTNAIRWSDLFSASSTGGYYGLYWNAIITDNNTISPDGSLNASKVVRGTDDVLIRALNVVTASTANTTTLWAKKGNYDKIIIDIGDEAASTITLTDEWQRIETTTSSALNTHIDISMPNSASGDYIYIYGFQAEQGSYATSYIPTSGQSGGVTRVADACSQTPPDGVIGQTEGTILVDVDFKTLSGTNMFVSIRPDASNKIEIYRSDAVIYGEFASNASFNFNKPSVTVGRYKIAVAYSSGSSAMYINGVLIGSNITPFAFTSTLDGIYINSRGTTFIEQSSYNDLKLYNTRLSNAELASLTTI